MPNNSIKALAEAKTLADANAKAAFKSLEIPEAVQEEIQKLRERGWELAQEIEDRTKLLDSCGAKLAELQEKWGLQ